METAKVDIRKLQLLNDRITQCIDALTQVRLSVHGLSHTSGLEGAQFGYPQNVGLDPRLAGAAFAPPWTSGLSHTTPGFAPMGGMVPGFLPGIGQPQGAFSQSPFGQPQGAFQQSPFGQPFINPLVGLSHSGSELEAYNRPTWADPVLAAKVTQTFPYARYAAPPVVSIY